MTSRREHGCYDFMFIRRLRRAGVRGRNSVTRYVYAHTCFPGVTFAWCCLDHRGPAAMDSQDSSVRTTGAYARAVAEQCRNVEKHRTTIIIIAVANASRMKSKRVERSGTIHVQMYYITARACVCVYHTRMHYISEYVHSYVVKMNE